MISLPPVIKTDSDLTKECTSLHEIDCLTIQRKKLRELQNRLRSPFFGSLESKACIAMIEEWLQ